MKGNPRGNIVLVRVIRGALALSVFCLGLSVLPAVAQEQGEQQNNANADSTQSRNLGTIQVLGSRIKRSNLAAPRPVLRITRQQIQETGLVNVGEILQRITSAGTSTNAKIDVGGNGTTTLNLRNLGSDRVLILVNGQRWITGLGGTVDLNQIPTSVIQNIEVLKDGASAIYGSDAIAGVVNIITKKDFNGAQASAYLGMFQHAGQWDGQTKQFSYTVGTGGDKGRLLFNVEYQENDEVKNCARAISCVPRFGTPFGSHNTPRGNFRFYPPSGSSLYSNAELCPPDATGEPLCDLTVKQGASGASISDYKRFTVEDQYNYAQLYDLIAPNQSTNIYMQGSWDFNRYVSFHSTAMYNHHFNLEVYSPRNIVVGGGQVQAQLISATNPYNPFGFDLDGTVSAPSPGVAELLVASLRPTAGGFRNFRTISNTYYYNGGFDGAFNWGRRHFTWNLDYVFGRELQWDNTPTGRFNFDRLKLALGPISNCGPGTPNPGCVPFNFFGSAPDTHNPEMFEYVVRETNSETTNTIRDYEFNLSSANILDLPGGPLGFNVGYEYRQLEGASHPDSLDVATQGTEATAGGYAVKSAYAELYIPLLANVPLVKAMDIDLAVRNSRFSTFGSHTTRQVGFKWQPDDQLLLRASWAQGFRAPNIGELFSPQSLGGAVLFDPCDTSQLPGESPQVEANCRADGVPVGYEQVIAGELDNGVLNGGNPNVQPETSESRSYGFVFSPDFLPGFNFNADYFKIDVDNLIRSFGALNILDACYVSGLQQYCDLIQRDNHGNIARLVNTETNIGGISTSGFDIGASYAFTTDVGFFNIKFESTFTRNYDVSLRKGTGEVETFHEIGWAIGQNYEGYPKNKSVLSANWNFGNWSALWRMRYIDDLIENCSGFVKYGVCSDPDRDHVLYTGAGLVPTNHLAATTYYDASVSYAVLAINSTLTLGVNNLFDTRPPVSYTAHNENFIPTIYDIPGRFVYFRMTAKF